MAFRSRWNSVQRTASMCWRHSIKVVESAVCRPCCISWPYRSWRNVHSGWWMRLIRLVQLLIAMWITALTALYLLLQASISTSHFFFFPVALHGFPKTLNTKIIVFLVSCTEKSNTMIKFTYSTRSWAKDSSKLPFLLLKQKVLSCLTMKMSIGLVDINSIVKLPLK